MTGPPAGPRRVAAHRPPGLSEVPRSPPANLFLDLTPQFLEGKSALSLASTLPFSFQAFWPWLRLIARYMISGGVAPLWGDGSGGNGAPS